MGDFSAAIASIDHANACDPNFIVVGGLARPKEVVHSEMMSAVLLKLDPCADETQKLAARAHHLRRWTIARASYPPGRAGYLRWRATLKAQHSEEIAGILGGCGYDDATITRVQQIIRKDDLESDAVVQTHEDALCIVFLRLQFGALADRLDDDKMIGVIAKTLAKMSPAGIDAALALPLSPTEADLVDRAQQRGVIGR